MHLALDKVGELFFPFNPKLRINLNEWQHQKDRDGTDHYPNKETLVADYFL